MELRSSSLYYPLYISYPQKFSMRHGTWRRPGPIGPMRSVVTIPMPFTSISSVHFWRVPASGHAPSVSLLSAVTPSRSHSQTAVADLDKAEEFSMALNDSSSDFVPEFQFIHFRMLIGMQQAGMFLSYISIGVLTNYRRVGNNLYLSIRLFWFSLLRQKPLLSVFYGAYGEG